MSSTQDNEPVGQQRDTAAPFIASFTANLYSDAKLVTTAPQPITVLFRDTVKTFLHEKLLLLSSSERLLAYLGIEVTILATLLTAEFKDIGPFKGSLITGAFFAFFIIFLFLLIKASFFWWNHRKEIAVDALAEDLMQRGTIIKPTDKA